MADPWGDKYFSSGRSYGQQASTATPGPVRQNAYTTGQQQQFNPAPQGPVREQRAYQQPDMAQFSNATGTPYLLARPGQPYDPATKPTPQSTAGMQQAYRNMQQGQFIDTEQAQGDYAYQQALMQLQRQLGVNAEQTDWSVEGNQLQHDQNAAFQNQIINNFGRDTSFIERALGLAGNTRDQDLARQGLSDQSIGLNEQDLLTNLYRSRRQLNNQYTAGGGWFTPERGLSHQDLNKGWETSQGQLNIQRAGNQINRQSIGTTYDQATLAHDKALAAAGDQDAIARLKLQFGDQDLAHANKGLGLEHAAYAANNAYQQGQLSAEQMAAAQKFEEARKNLGG